jgi:hypothetical protein
MDPTARRLAAAHAERAAFYAPHSAAKARFHEQRAARHLTRAAAGFGADKRPNEAPAAARRATQRRHLVFVLSPLNARAAKKLQELVQDSLGRGESVHVLMQAFTEPADPAFADVCAAGPESACTNILPAQFNQYCSDDPMALPKLMRACPKAEYYVFPTQLTKNVALNATFKAEFRERLVEQWATIDADTRRKVVQWHTKPKTAAALDEAVRGARSSEDIRAILTDPDGTKTEAQRNKVQPMFDPFCVYYAAKRLDESSVCAASEVTRYVAASGRIPHFVEAEPRDGTAATVRVVAHANAAVAKGDGAPYAQYIMTALASGPRRAGPHTTVSLFQDWLDWDNLIAARCVLHSFGEFTLYSVGRPVPPPGVPHAPAPTVDWKAKFDESKHAHGPLPMWPPYVGAVDDARVDDALSEREAADVAYTWRRVLDNWGARSSAVENVGYTARHGMNPATHTAPTDIYHAPHAACTVL